MNTAEKLYEVYQIMNKNITSGTMLKQFCNNNNLKPIIKEECPESEDSSLTVKFQDGSEVYVATLTKHSLQGGITVTK